MSQFSVLLDLSLGPEGRCCSMEGRVIPAVAGLCWEPVERAVLHSCLAFHSMVLRHEALVYLQNGVCWPVFTALFLTIWFIYPFCLKDRTKCPEPGLVLGDEVKTPPPHTLDHVVKALGDLAVRY